MSPKRKRKKKKFRVELGTDGFCFAGMLDSLWDGWCAVTAVAACRD